MKTVTWTENASWDDVLRQAGEEDVLVVRDGHPVILMTPFNDDDLAWYARRGRSRVSRIAGKSTPPSRAAQDDKP